MAITVAIWNWISFESHLNLKKSSLMLSLIWLEYDAYIWEIHTGNIPKSYSLDLNNSPAIFFCFFLQSESLAALATYGRRLLHCRGGTIYWKILKTNILVISMLILILKSGISKYWYRYWYWNLPFIYIATNIAIEKNMNIDIGIDIDIGEIKSIFVDLYGIFTGITYSIFKTNFVQLPLWFYQKLEYLLEVFTLPLI